MSKEINYFGRAFNDLHIKLCLEEVPKQEGFDRIRELFVNLEKLCTGDPKLVASMARELVDLREFKRKNEEAAHSYPILLKSYNELEKEYLALVSPDEENDDNY